jgi:hypothetical protein
MKRTVRNLFVGGLFSVIRSLLAALASAQNAQVPAVPAGGLDPSKQPDIESIHLGMSTERTSLAAFINILRERRAASTQLIRF